MLEERNMLQTSETPGLMVSWSKGNLS